MAAIGRFRAKDEELAIQLARGVSIRAAAEGSGYSERTVARRLKDPAFCRRLKEIRIAATERAINGLTDAATEAVDTIRKLLSADSEQVRLGAGKAILDSSLKYREHDWDRRLSADEALEMVQTMKLVLRNKAKENTSPQVTAGELQQIVERSFE